MVGGFFPYPWIWEPILMVFYRTLSCCKKQPYTDEFENVAKRGCNLVYHPKYNIKMCGLEKRGPFDLCKFERVIDFLRTDHQILLGPESPAKTELKGSKCFARGPVDGP